MTIEAPARLSDEHDQETFRLLARLLDCVQTSDSIPLEDAGGVIWELNEDSWLKITGTDPMSPEAVAAAITELSKTIDTAQLNGQSVNHIHTTPKGRKIEFRVGPIDTLGREQPLPGY